MQGKNQTQYLFPVSVTLNKIYTVSMWLQRTQRKLYLKKFARIADNQIQKINPQMNIIHYKQLNSMLTKNKI